MTMKLILTCSLCLLLAAGLSNPLQAQQRTPPSTTTQKSATMTSTQTTGGNGAIEGRITNASGNGVADVRVELESTSNGMRMTVMTDPSGNYRFVDVPAGRYRVFTSSGQAATAPARDVDVQVTQLTTVNMVLSRDNNRATAAIDAAEVAGDTSTGQIMSVYNTKYIHYLPHPNLVTRNGEAYGALNLSLLQAGVASGGGMAMGRGPAVAGADPITNNFHVDGIDNNNKAAPGPLVYVSNEATTSFSLMQNQHSPELGHAMGGKFNNFVRTGTNQFHGALYNYLQNRHMNAVDQSMFRQGFLENPRHDQNRLGASAGLPIVPSKLFFFGNFEYIPFGFERPFAGTVFAPTAAGFATLNSFRLVSPTNLGILQNQLGVAPGATTTLTVTGQPIPFGPVNTAVRGWQNQWMGTGAVDATMSHADQFRLRYVHNRIESTHATPALPAFNTPRGTTSLLGSLGWYHTFNSVVTNEFRFGYNRLNDQFNVGSFNFPGLDVFPNIQISNLNLNLGPNLASAQSSIINTYHLADGVNWNMGRHTIRFGVDGRRLIGSQSGFATARGLFGFSSIERFLLDLPPDVISQRSFGDSYFSGNQWLWFGYLQDHIMMTPNFSMDLGVRYQYASIPASVKRFTRNAAMNAPGVLEFREPETDWNNFAPHIGIAWSPTQMRNVVFRAGAGMSYDALNANLYSFSGIAPFLGPNVFGNLASDTAGFFRTGALASPNFSALTDVQQRALTAAFVPIEQELPYAMQWNASVQTVIWPRATLEVKYMGARGLNLPRMSILNGTQRVTADRSLPLFFTRPSQAELNALPLTLNDLQNLPGSTLAAAGFTSPLRTLAADGKSWYHGLGVQLNQRFAAGFQMLGAWTWSHSLVDSFGSDLDLSRGRHYTESLFDRRHRVTATAVWDVADAFRDTTSAVRNVLANLVMSGTYTYETPLFVPALSGVDAGLNFGGLGAGVIVNPNGIAGTGTDVTALRNGRGQVVGFMANDPNARFVRAGAGVFTNGAFPRLGLDHTNNFDVALAKGFSWQDKLRFELRGEAYNVFNHPQFVGGDINSIGVQRIPSTFFIPGAVDFNNPRIALASNARLLQVALRLTF